jgi:glycosyltransferase involved in cell wall biosynthesis
MEIMNGSNSGGATRTRICLFSQRHLERLVSRCAEYEFEDIICEVDDAELLVSEPHRWFSVGKKLVNRLARHFHTTFINPGVRKLCLNKNYDLFVVICQFPRDLLSLSAIKGWKQRCGSSVCWLAEFWMCEVNRWKSYLKILSQFDYIVLTSSATVELIKNAIEKPCVYMPPGIDAIKFCPYPNLPDRCVDVYSLGRKSPVTHQALLEMVERGQIFYIYDTVPNMDTFCPRQHRSLVANIAKRSRYFIANAPKIDRQSETHGQGEVSYRFFEGAASGTVMIGEPRQNDAFKKHFDWPDAVINVPYDTTNIAQILADLDSQPERLERIRKNNIVQCLLRHDWAYRWRAILDMVGLEPRPGLLAREERLRKLAEHVQQAC